MKRRKLNPRQTVARGVMLLCLLAVVPFACFGAPANAADEAARSTLTSLASFVKLRDDLKKEIGVVKDRIAKAQAGAERVALEQDLAKLETDVRTLSRNIEDVATGVDTSKLRGKDREEFDFQKEVLALLRPAIDEVKQMTAHVRQKADLREKIAYYDERLPILEQAITNLEGLGKHTDEKLLQQALDENLRSWKKQYSFMSSEREAAQLQLDKLLASETSLTEASRSYLKSFFQKRGLFLIEAALVVLGVILVSRFSHAVLRRYVPGFREVHRSFRVRLVELIHRLATSLLIVIGPMVVFYLVEDWVLFSVGLLLLIGAALALRQAIPRYWQQVQIFLNVGAVREGERIYLDGLPWLVEQINIFCVLINPTTELSQRLHISRLVELKSRPCGSDEPWFPCRKGDWVILNDGVRGKVIGVSPEMVQLVERGGAQITYTAGDFLAKSPRNLATNFRIKETIGISYALQKDSTTVVTTALQSYIGTRIDEEGYGDALINLRVEFARAGESALEIVVIADFRGELGDLFNRLRRAIQRWCVDACTEYGWEIPFPQLTVHGSLARA